MAVRVVLVVSIGLRLLAAALALRLIRISGQRRAWSLLAGAFFLMAVRQAITLYQATTQPPGVDTALLGLAISGLTVLAVTWAGRLLLAMRRSQQALRDSEARYRTLFEGAAEGILVADVEAEGFKYANPAYAGCSGTPRKR